jgi:hypothetical protein
MQLCLRYLQFNNEILITPGRLARAIIAALIIIEISPSLPKKHMRFIVFSSEIFSAAG